MPKFSRRAEARPDEILDAALQAFVASGFAATRIEEVASAAGVTAGTIYRYFPSKEALVAALVARPRQPEWHRGREVAEAYGSSTARQLLELLVRRWTAELTVPANLGLLLLVVREAARFPAESRSYVADHLAQGRVGFGRAIRHGIDRGEFPLIDVDGTADMITSALLSGVAWEHDFGAGSTVALLDGLIRGLPRPSPAAFADERPAAAPPPPTVLTPGEPVIPEGQVRIVNLVPPAGGAR